MPHLKLKIHITMVSRLQYERKSFVLIGVRHNTQRKNAIVCLAAIAFVDVTTTLSLEMQINFSRQIMTR